MFRVEEEGTKETFALKRINLQPEDLDKLQHEVQIMVCTLYVVFNDYFSHTLALHIQKLLPKHKNIVAFHSSTILSSSDRSDYAEASILMEFVPGRLMEELTARNRDGKAFSEVEVLTILRDVCEAINVLHQHNPPIVHRDIKSTLQ